MTSLFLFLLGLAVGSFINCLVYRLNSFTSQESRSLPRHLRGVFWGRSFCPRCKHKLVWCDNIPLLSFVLLRGKCRYCQKPISTHYPLIELLTGLLFVIVYWWVLSWCHLNCSIALLFYCFIGASLIAIFLSDLLYQTVPDEIVYPAIGLTILFQLCRPTVRGVLTGHLGGGTTVGVLSSGLMAAGFFLVLVLITKGKGMGLGDVKLAGLMGLVLGYPKIIVALYLAFLTGAIVGVILILLGKKRFGEHIPFGPFLSIATIISLFWGEIIWNQGLGLLLLSF